MAEGLEEEVVDRVVEAAFAAVPQQVVQQVQADRQLAEQLQREEEAGGHVSPPAVGAADGSVSSSAVLGMGISLPHHLSLIPVVWWSVVPVPQKIRSFFFPLDLVSFSRGIFIWIFLGGVNFFLVLFVVVRLLCSLSSSGRPSWSCCCYWGGF